MKRARLWCQVYSQERWLSGLKQWTITPPHPLDKGAAGSNPALSAN
jgi:hypothetical protein